MQYFEHTPARRSGFLSTVAVATFIVAGMAGAQSLRNTQGPAEMPPSSFGANQYVDSEGCVYIRAEINGMTDWVPRVSRTREQLCGFESTLIADREVTPDAAPRPVEPAPTTIAEPSIVPAIVTVAAPLQSTTPASTPTPVARTPVAVQQPTQSAAVAPVAAAETTQMTEVSHAVPEPMTTTRVMTRAQACAGLTGVQTHLISQRTGNPIDCGGQAPAVTTGMAPAPTSADEQPRLSRAQACADIATSDREYVSTTTGQPLLCGAFAGVRAGLSAPPRRYVNPLDAPAGSIFVPVPAAYTANLRPRNYTNPLDLAPGSASAPQVQTNQTATVSTRTAPQTTQRAEQLSGHRYVQVGTFGTRDQAQDIAQALRARGLPMRIGVFDQNGQQMRIVLAGPFGTDTQLQTALGTARGAGFSGAFTRQ